ncbi:uncharacterized protein LOC108864442 [Galendromus occidentalis]|uniref:Uncharacterized protein LOC108864442 n=1 Tax=Galendromus occidentalis TaxID=34638 RepID=A0AAJ7P9Y1_9ACAR|nr:uncharacterized protein LOC108864442 [Galendromus occidentalis]
MALLNRLSIIVYYTIYVLPGLIAAIVNFAVFIVVRRSEVLQSSKILRNDLFLNLALGNSVTFLVTVKAVLFPEMLYYETICRGWVYLAETSQLVIQLSLILAALSRYLNVLDPYKSAASILRGIPAYFLWIIAAVLCAPYLATHGLIFEGETTQCDILPDNWTEFITIVSIAFYLIPTMIYVFLTHLALRVIPKEDGNNHEIETVDFASRIVRISFLIAFIALAPLQMVSLLKYGFYDSLFTLGPISSLLLALASILEPVGFAILDSVFRGEYRLQTSLPDPIHSEGFGHAEFNTRLDSTMSLGI